MSDFIEFKEAVREQFDRMSKFVLFKTDISKEDLFNTYLDSFPEGTNEIYRERRRYDCQCCKSFIRSCGNVVAIENNKLISIWDVKVGGYYQEVADALSKLVKEEDIRDVFLHFEKNLGTDKNLQELEDGNVLQWDHFHFVLPTKFVNTKDRDKVLGDYRTTKDVFKRALEEITLDSLDTVLELIDQNSLYRGVEYKKSIEKFRDKMLDYFDIHEQYKDMFYWQQSMDKKTPARIRNTAIGTLLLDLSNDIELDIAVKKFEAMVAPANYKRPTALITKGMISKAQEKVAELGIEESLHRRYAVAEDITINNVLFADREAKKAMNVFDELAETIPDKVKNFDKIEEIPIEDFLDNVLPKIDSMELLIEGRHSGNLMSLVAPEDVEAKPIFKWHNNFSWSYNGDVTDSIKERVKNAGGSVTGALRCSLSWYNTDDLDIHVIEPGGNTIYYNDKLNTKTGGRLDVDMNAGTIVTNPVENITWPSKLNMEEGIYQVIVHNFTKRGTKDKGFEVEIEYDGSIQSFHYEKVVKDGEKVHVANFKFSKGKPLEFVDTIESKKASKEIWSITTEKFHKVAMLMNSPNHWDERSTGNKHLFFILDKCRNNESARGFYNEFLKEDLNEHRKVFEVLGNKMKVEKSDRQLSGLGFSTTQRNSVLCRVTGSFSRTLKINF